MRVGATVYLGLSSPPEPNVLCWHISTSYEFSQMYIGMYVFLIYLLYRIIINCPKNPLCPTYSTFLPNLISVYCWSLVSIIIFPGYCKIEFIQYLAIYDWILSFSNLILRFSISFLLLIPFYF